MREANPRAHVNRLIGERNFLGAYLYLKDADLERDEFVELVGLVAGSVVDELSRTRREDRERVYFLRSILAWILRDVPGLGSLYREQLREGRGGTDWLSSVGRGFRNARDVASGKKSVSEGIGEAAEDARRGFEDATDAWKSGEAGSRLTEFLGNAEAGIRQGLDQFGEFLRTLNEQSAPGDGETGDAAEEGATDAESAARAHAKRDVEDAEYEEDSAEDDITIERDE
jgi:hypothetical protein